MELRRRSAKLIGRAFRRSGGDVVGLLRVLRIHQWCVGGYGHGIRCRTELEDDIDPHRLGDQNRHALLNIPAEAWRFNGHGIYTRRHLREGVVAGLGGGGPILGSSIGVPQDDRGIRDDGVNRIRNRTIDRPAVALGKGTSGQGQNANGYTQVPQLDLLVYGCWASTQKRGSLVDGRFQPRRMAVPGRPPKHECRRLSLCRAGGAVK